jgi:glyoxylase I family protein
MTSIQGYHHLSLSVGDLEKSAAWYGDVLDLEVEAQIEGNGFRRTRLRAPESGVTLALTQHDAPSSGLFDERRIGMDHVAFSVGDAGAVRALKTRFERLGVEHSEVKEGASGAAVITLRDPDNIQVEVFGGAVDPAIAAG